MHKTRSLQMWFSHLPAKPTEVSAVAPPQYQSRFFPQDVRLLNSTLHHEQFIYVTCLLFMQFLKNFFFTELLSVVCSYV